MQIDFTQYTTKDAFLKAFPIKNKALYLTGINFSKNDCTHIIQLFEPYIGEGSLCKIYFNQKIVARFYSDKYSVNNINTNFSNKNFTIPTNIEPTVVLTYSKTINI